MTAFAKQLIFGCGIQHSWYQLFPDTKLTEYIFEEVVGGYGAGNFAELEQGELDI
jgi:hypothetical protein